jgi:hypothetical protein
MVPIGDRVTSSRVHHVFVQIAELEQHGVEVATAHDLLLDRLLDPFDGNHLVTDQERGENRHTQRHVGVTYVNLSTSLQNRLQTVLRERQGRSHGRIDPQDPSPEARNHKTSFLERGHFRRGETALGPDGAPELTGLVVESDRSMGSRSEEHAQAVARNPLQALLPRDGGADDGNVVAFALSRGFCADSSQPLDP